MVAAIASLLTGPVRRRAVGGEPVGVEFAAVAGQGSWEPSELVRPADEAEASQAARQAGSGAPSGSVRSARDDVGPRRADITLARPE